MTYTPTAWADGDCVMAADMNNIENGVDRAQGDVMILRGLTAARPASNPLLVGRIYFATDAPYEISRDNGAGWDVVGYTNDLFTALGTLQVGTGAGAAAPLGIGAAGNVLTVAAGTAAWAAPAGGAWTLIAETILAAPAANVTFAAIPGTYRALVLFCQARTDLAAELGAVNWQANADGGNNYDRHYIQSRGAASAVATARGVASARLGLCEAANSRANTLGSSLTYWDGYASAATEKRSYTTNSGCMGDLSADLDVYRHAYWCGWRNTAPITQLTTLPNVGPNFVAPSRFALYGIT